MVFHRIKSSKQNGPVVEAEKDAKMLLDHDLRSAISDVLGGLQLLDLSQIGAENQTQITRIAAAAKLAVRLLDAGKHWNAEAPSDEGKIPINLSQLLANMQPRWVGHVAAQGLDLLFKIEIDPETRVNCDPLNLERVLSNVLENAAKFASTGQIILSVAPENDRISFKVTDQGPGFSDAALATLFTQGGRPSDSSKSGSGLGLFIAHGIVQRMGGQITARNTGYGAEVAFALPVAGSDRSLLVQKAVTQHLKGKRILLAEDNRTNQIVAGQMLQALGAEVIIADDGVAALAVLQEQTFDLALLDIEMPRKSGLELIQELRALGPPLAQLPLVALTAYAMREHRQRILESGADGIIAKPLTNIDSFGSEILQYLVPTVAPRRTPERSKGQTVVDFEVFNALRVAVGAEVFVDLIDTLLTDLEDVYQRLRSGFARHNVGEISKASHVLIALAGAIGATTLLEAAQALNKVCHSDQAKGISGQENCTLELLAELTVFLQSESSNTGGE